MGGTGYLQNPNEIGHGYETGTVNQPDGNKLTWHFKAPNVHDFAWAADPDYIHDTIQVPNGPVLRFLYKNNSDIIDNWKRLQPKTVELMHYFNKNIGNYPYKQYSVIQGGDGGMEYAMCTLITGERKFESLFRVTAHELAHSWFQFLLATNESKHEWIDEGFTSYITDLVEAELTGNQKDNPTIGAYDSYFKFYESNYEQPLSTHADRYSFTHYYYTLAYSKGEVFLAQLGYVIGDDNLKQTLKNYYTTWAFKHPTPNDFIRVAEKTSGLELDWYLTDFTQTTNTIDYAIRSIKDKTVNLERLGLMPMPIDIRVTYMDNSIEDFYIPLQMMRGEKPTKATIIKDWAWAYPTYSFEASKVVKSVEIDPSGLMADVDKSNNKK